MRIIECIQRSPEWFAAKCGIPSASNTSKIITNAGKPSKQREGYLHTLVAETITGQSADNFISTAMQMGTEREDESRQLYELITGTKVEQVGIVYKDEKKECLCSPDGLINREYGLELKNVLPKTQVKYLLENKLPTEHFAQIQFSLYVTGFQRWDFFSYSPNLPILFIRVTRDEAFLKALEAELKIFCKELKEVVERIR